MLRPPSGREKGVRRPPTLAAGISPVNVALLTREFPPHIYGGAGVAVEYLSEALSKLVDLKVYCFGEERESPLVAASYEPWAALDSGSRHDAALQAIAVDL